MASDESPQDEIRTESKDSSLKTASAGTGRKSIGKLFALFLVVAGFTFMWLGGRTVARAVSDTQDTSAVVTGVTRIPGNFEDRRDSYDVTFRLDEGGSFTRRLSEGKGKKVRTGQSVQIEQTRGGAVVRIVGPGYEVSNQGPLSVVMGMFFFCFGCCFIVPVLGQWLRKEPAASGQ